MFETTKLRNLIRDTMTDSLCNHDDLLAARAYHRDRLLQDISTDIQKIIDESNVSVELAIDEWISTDGHITTSRHRRRQRMVSDALKRFPVVS